MNLKESNIIEELMNAILLLNAHPNVFALYAHKNGYDGSLEINIKFLDTGPIQKMVDDGLIGVIKACANWE